MEESKIEVNNSYLRDRYEHTLIDCNDIGIALVDGRVFLGLLDTPCKLEKIYKMDSYDFGYSTRENHKNRTNSFYSFGKQREKISNLNLVFAGEKDEYPHNYALVDGVAVEICPLSEIFDKNNDLKPNPSYEISSKLSDKTMSLLQKYIPYYLSNIKDSNGKHFVEEVYGKEFFLFQLAHLEKKINKIENAQKLENDNEKSL